MFAWVVFQELGVSCMWFELKWLRLGKTTDSSNGHAEGPWGDLLNLQRPVALLYQHLKTIPAPFSNHLSHAPHAPEAPHASHASDHPASLFFIPLIPLALGLWDLFSCLLAGLPFEQALSLLQISSVSAYWLAVSRAGRTWLGNWTTDTGDHLRWRNTHLLSFYI